MKNHKILTIIVALYLFGCDTPQQTQSPNKLMDEHSFSKPAEVVISHLSWNAEINFKEQIINATATYDIKRLSSVDSIVFDTYDLKILSIVDQSDSPLLYTIGKKIDFLGSPLNIKILDNTNKVKISYETNPSAQALQWLTPSQTSGKENPFLFTQSQAILARSWIPIQDSPGIRFTYEATVKVPENLIALMSATNPVKKDKTGIYKFKMDQPIPAYLLALSVGDLEFASLGQRSGVYAESDMLQKCISEFEDLEAMISAAEKLYGPYQWDRYDLLVLPPSFPFGGMENPRLTFATPTIIAGDKSLISLVAHELAHSWSGNLVTNATWNDFWLNEGFTVYFEYRIMESLYGRSYSEMLATLSLQDLKSEVREMKNSGNDKDIALKLNLDHRNPDDGMTSIAYDKGYFFVRLLEETVGRPKWDNFLKEYFSNRSFQTITTEQFVSIIEEELGIDSMLYQPWIYGFELPENCPIPVSNKFEIVENAMDNWLKNQNKDTLVKKFNTDEWSTHEWLKFIRSIPNDFGLENLSTLDDAFHLSESSNSEVFAAWAIHAIANSYQPCVPFINDFLIQTGRRKFLMPLYKEMIKTESGKIWAQEVYNKARPNYHSVAYNSLDPLLNY